MAVAIGGYLLGSIPFALLVTRWLRGVDLRSTGSGHAGATNVLRTAGPLAGLLVVVLDGGKGVLVIALAAPWGPAAGAVAALAVVSGHCWPLFTGFRGGMGVATTGGVLLALWPLGFVLAVGVDALLNLLLRHSARANVISGLVLGLLYWIAGPSRAAALAAAAACDVVSLRALSDWNRVYSELWLDRRVEPD